MRDKEEHILPLGSAPITRSSCRTMKTKDSVQLNASLWWWEWGTAALRRQMNKERNKEGRKTLNTANIRKSAGIGADCTF